MVVELGVNQIILTLNEKVALVSPEFVMIIENDTTSKKVACKLGTDLSSYPTRYNKFNLTLKTSPVAANAEVYLVNSRSHKYFVYEYADADTFDFSGVDTLDLSTIESKLVESGIMEYITDEQEINYYRDQRLSVKTYHA